MLVELIDPPTTYSPALMSVKSGLFNYDVVNRPCPDGYTKITEGTTAVLEPPPKERCTETHSNNSTTTSPAPSRLHVSTGDDIDATTKTGRNAQQQQLLEEVEDQAVFYNPAQVVNRDLSISVIELFSRLRLREPRRRGGTTSGITILEALSATGLRAIRYYKEITNVRYIIANDMDSDAVDCIVRNCAYNDVPVSYPTLTENMPATAVELHEAKTENETEVQTEIGVRAGGAIIPNLDDANDLMFRLAMNSNVHPGQRTCLMDSGSPTAEPRPLLQQELMDVVDLDPYGSASPFLEGAFRCIKEGGLMLVTSTDSAILCGNFADTAHAKYSSLPYKAPHCHEAAVRTLLACVERVANKHKKYIVPILSLHIDFYVRCFFRVYTQAAEVKLSACKLGYQLQCANCCAFWVRPMATARVPRASRQDRRRHRREEKEKQRVAHVQGQRETLEAEKIKTVAEEDMKAPAGRASTPAGSKRMREEEERGEDDEETHGPRKEVYPVPPNRQSNPKVTPLTLQQLPSSTRVTTTTASSQSCCAVCGGNVVLSGPLYCAPTQSREFLQQLLDLLQERAGEGRLNAEARITGLVRTAMDELPDCPLFYLLPDIASYVRVRCPPTPYIVAALARLGYRCSQVHCAAAGLKTDCPPELLFAVMLRWKEMQDEMDAQLLSSPATAGESNAGDVVVDTSVQPPQDTTERATGRRPLLVSPLMEADFTYAKAYDFRGRVMGVAKFVPNEPGWGPKRRHQGAAPTAAGEDVADSP